MNGYGMIGIFMILVGCAILVWFGATGRLTRDAIFGTRHKYGSDDHLKQQQEISRASTLSAREAIFAYLYPKDGEEEVERDLLRRMVAFGAGMIALGTFFVLAAR